MSPRLRVTPLKNQKLNIVVEGNLTLDDVVANFSFDEVAPHFNFVCTESDELIEVLFLIAPFNQLRIQKIETFYNQLSYKPLLVFIGDKLEEELLEDGSTYSKVINSTLTPDLIFRTNKTNFRTVFVEIMIKRHEQK